MIECSPTELAVTFPLGESGQGKELAELLRAELPRYGLDSLMLTGSEPDLFTYLEELVSRGVVACAENWGS